MKVDCVRNKQVSVDTEFYDIERWDTSCFIPASKSAIYASRREFLDPDSEAAKAIDKEFWVKKEIERPKFRPTDVVKQVQAAGFKTFRVTPEHSNMWRMEDAKKDGKGFGVNVAGVWYWYQNWIDRCIELCRAAGDEYK